MKLKILYVYLWRKQRKFDVILNKNQSKESYNKFEKT